MTPETFDKWLSSSGMSLRQAAEAAGIDKSKLSRWRRGAGKLSKAERSRLEERAEPGSAARQAPAIVAGDPISTALSASAEMMRVLIDVAMNPDASPQVRVAAASRVLAYSPGRPGPLKDAPPEGVSEEAQAKLAAMLRKMASGIETASQIEIPDPPAPVTSQDPPSQATDGD